MSFDKKGSTGIEPDFGEFGDRCQEYGHKWQEFECPGGCGVTVGRECKVCHRVEGHLSPAEHMAQTGCPGTPDEETVGR